MRRPAHAEIGAPGRAPALMGTASSPSPPRPHRRMSRLCCPAAWQPPYPSRRPCRVAVKPFHGRQQRWLLAGASPARREAPPRHSRLHRRCTAPPPLLYLLPLARAAPPLELVATVSPMPASWQLAMAAAQTVSPSIPVHLVRRLLHRQGHRVRATLFNRSAATPPWMHPRPRARSRTAESQARAFCAA